MSFKPTSTHFYPVIPKSGGGPTTGINEFGQHKYILLRRICEAAAWPRAQLFAGLSMSDATCAAALEKLVVAQMATDAGGVVAATELGRSTLAGL